MTTTNPPVALVRSRRSRTGHPGGAPLLLAAVLTVGFSLRGPLASLSPVVDVVSGSLALTASQAGLLTSVPVLAFALLTLPASGLIARIGPERAIMVALGAITAGQVVRSAGTLAAALAGTALLGAGITVGNVAVPVIITRDFQARAASVTGAYTAALNVGATLTTLLTVPLTTLWGWQWALAGWGVLAVLAFGMVQVARRRGRRSAALAPVPPPRRPPAPSAGGGAAAAVPREKLGPTMLVITAMVTAGFAIQSFSYYAMTAWLPQILGARLPLDAAAAGALASVFQVMGIVGSLAVPIALARRVPMWVIAVVIPLCWALLPLGLLIHPPAALAWVAVAGAAQGGNYALIVTLIATRAPSVTAARRSWVIIQTIGYTCAALAPTLMGAVSGATGGWTVPLASIAFLLLVMGVLMPLASRQGQPEPTSGVEATMA